MSTRMTTFSPVSITALVVASFVSAAQAQSLPIAEKLYANAAASFQQARFSEAYGRFVGLADAGYTPAAELALFMAQHGSVLFGKDWDVTQEQLSAWAALTGRPAPVLKARVYLRTGAQGSARRAVESR